MAMYVLNKNAQANGDQEVHVVGCAHGPDKDNQISLGSHVTCKGAMQEAAKHTKHADGCFYCCNACHKS